MGVPSWPSGTPRRPPPRDLTFPPLGQGRVTGDDGAGGFVFASVLFVLLQ